VLYEHTSFCWDLIACYREHFSATAAESDLSSRNRRATFHAHARSAETADRVLLRRTAQLTATPHGRDRQGQPRGETLNREEPEAARDSRSYLRFLALDSHSAWLPESQHRMLSQRRIWRSHLWDCAKPVGRRNRLPHRGPHVLHDRLVVRHIPNIYRRKTVAPALTHVRTNGRTLPSCSHLVSKTVHYEQLLRS